MALTLTEAAKLSNDVLQVGVIETVVKESAVLQVLPFIEVVGNGLTYNRENVAASASFFNVGDTWTEDTPTFTQQTATLKILGGDADIDNFLLATRSNIQDLEAAVIQLKAKAVQQKFDDTFINGDTVADAKSFDGIDKLTTSGQTVSMGTNGGTLTLTKLDELVDLVKPGRPDLLLMSKRSRRTMNELARSGNFVQTDRNEFGQMVQFYDGIPIGISEHISDAQTVGTSTDTSTVYAVQFGEGGLAGLTSPGGLQVERVGSLATQDATRTRVKWYVSLALFNALKSAKLTGVRP
ncbi:MAG: phage major capsid protein [Chloroflexi bacterium]|nr:phage major capsid protein [Chloroflexota bacterium]